MSSSNTSELISKLSDVINDDRVKLLKNTLAERTRYLTVVLDDIYQPQNTSAIIRTSECLGIQDIHIVEDKNEHKVNKMVVKGASKWIDLHKHRQQPGREACIEELKQNGYKIVSMTLDDDSIALEQLPISEKLAICFGCEETGISKHINDESDYRVQIPITGFTQSYNVSVSAGISLYYLINKIKDSVNAWQLDENEHNEILLKWLSISTPTGKTILEKYKDDIKPS